MTRSFSGLSRRLSLEQQLIRLRQRWGGEWRIERVPGGILATGRVRPEPACRSYKVRIRYSGKYPIVRVVDPLLRKMPEGKRVPHTYADGSLCLYHPDYGDWSTDKAIADTIVPWVSEWLYFYEFWLATNVWLGGGVHPKRGKVDRSK